MAAHGRDHVREAQPVPCDIRINELDRQWLLGSDLPAEWRTGESKIPGCNFGWR